MGRDNSLHGLEAFDQLTLEKARTQDVEDLDDDGWRIAMRKASQIQCGGLPLSSDRGRAFRCVIVESIRYLPKHNTRTQLCCASTWM